MDAFGLDAYCLFPQCVQAVIPLRECGNLWPTHASREMEAMGRACSHFLVAGPLTVVRICGEVVQPAQGPGKLQ